MFSPSEIAAEIRVFVDTFIIRWNINQDVANKLLRSHPEVQWRVISNQVPRCVHNPNGFVMSRIIKATNSRSDLRSASEDVVHGAMQPDEMIPQPSQVMQIGAGLVPGRSPRHFLANRSLLRWWK